jgi:glycosyltransferase involved in cell wall biosynthesis
MSQLSNVLNEYNMTNEDIEKIEEVLSNPQYHLDLAENLRALRVEKKFTKAHCGKRLYISYVVD